VLLANGFAIFAVLALIVPRKRGTWGGPGGNRYPQWERAVLESLSQGLRKGTVPVDEGRQFGERMGYFFSEEISLMIRLRKFLVLVPALLVGVSMLAAPTQARADFQVEVSINGGAFVAATVTTLDSQDAQYSYVVSGVITISGTLASNFPGAPTGAGLTLANTTNVKFASATVGSVEIVSTQTGFTAPASSPLLLSSSGGGTIQNTSGTATSASSTYQGVLDPNNLDFGAGNGSTIVVGTPPPAVHSTPAMTASGTAGGTTSGTGTAPLVYSPGTATNLVASATPFSLTNVLTFSGQSTVNEVLAGSWTTTAAPVPVPAGLVLALTGLPCLGLGRWLRRRRQARLTAV
jgi:hypothetical protein